MTRIAITCEDCGRRHQLERPVGEAGMIWIVCHDCELPIQAMFDTPATPEPVLPSRSFQDTWAGMFNVSSGSTPSL
ncbi:MAG: hypothetical protein QOE72_2405 [Chloroflexota bacterium]|jgi:hypothetical protein|nr:hypothetical protein [Chloroflexota bacterium]